MEDVIQKFPDISLILTFLVLWCRHLFAANLSVCELDIDSFDLSKQYPEITTGWRSAAGPTSHGCLLPSPWKGDACALDMLITIRFMASGFIHSASEYRGQFRRMLRISSYFSRTSWNFSQIVIKVHQRQPWKNDSSNNLGYGSVLL